MTLDDTLNLVIIADGSPSNSIPTRAGMVRPSRLHQVGSYLRWISLLPILASKSHVALSTYQKMQPKRWSRTPSCILITTPVVPHDRNAAPGPNSRAKGRSKWCPWNQENRSMVTVAEWQETSTRDIMFSLPRPQGGGAEWKANLDASCLFQKSSQDEVLIVLDACLRPTGSHLIPPCERSGEESHVGCP